MNEALRPIAPLTDTASQPRSVIAPRAARPPSDGLTRGTMPASATNPWDVGKLSADARWWAKSAPVPI